MRRLLGSALLLTLTAAEAADAHLMVDGNAVAGLDSWAFSGSSPDSSLLSFDGGLTDHLFEFYGYLGNASSVVRVTPLHFDELAPIAGVGSTASSQLVLNAVGAAELGLLAGDIRLDYAFEISETTRSLVWDVGVTNASTASLDLVFYAYLDLDLEGDFGNDLATGGAGGFLVTDGATGFDLSVGSTTAADRFEVAPYPNLQSALDGMLGVGAANLADAGTPFGPADFTGALQFDFSLAPGGSQDFGMTLIPEPATAILLALGLLGLAFAGRKPA
ncbi:MAG TPA: PEP-CTERM sorting domain-containing protein [Myxococcota bacterium]|jgi:hypothetical protein